METKDYDINSRPLEEWPAEQFSKLSLENKMRYNLVHLIQDVFSGTITLNEALEQAELISKMFSKSGH